MECLAACRFYQHRGTECNHAVQSRVIRVGVDDVNHIFN